MLNTMVMFICPVLDREYTFWANLAKKKLSQPRPQLIFRYKRKAKVFWDKVEKAKLPN